MQLIHLQPPTPSEAVSLFETLPPDTLALIDWPASVSCGCNCPYDRVNWDYCADHNIPVARAIVQGASYYYRDGDALFLALVTEARYTQRQVLDAVCEVLQRFVPGVFVDENDLRIGASRCGMSSPELQRADGAWLNVMEVLLHSDLGEARMALAFPLGMWDHKPVSVLEDWIHPLDMEIQGDVRAIVGAVLLDVVQALTGDTWPIG